MDWAGLEPCWRRRDAANVHIAQFGLSLTGLQLIHTAALPA